MPSAEIGALQRDRRRCADRAALHDRPGLPHRPQACASAPTAAWSARVTLEHGVRLGARALIHPGAVIGADGFGLARDGGRWLKVPQVGSGAHRR